MGILSWIIVGLLAGTIARFILPGNHGGGLIRTLVLGLIGAFLGGFIGRWLGYNPNLEFFSWSTWLCAIAGSMIVLLIAGFVRGGRR